MAFIFLDESGDLGFKNKKSSKYFIITCLFSENKRQIEKIVKKTHSELNKKLKKKTGILHSSKEKPVIRKRLLRRLVKTNCLIMTIYLNKEKVYTKLHNEKQVLYNFVVNILLDRIYSKKIIPTKDKIYLIASKRETNKFLNNNFKNYLNSQVRNRHKSDLSVLIKTPYEEKALQAVDFVSWSVFRKYENGDKTYYELIKERVIEESPLFP